jgi:quinol monooxygenase YgiN
MNQENPASVSHVLTIRLTADEPIRSSMIDTLRGIAGPTRVHPGCHSLGVYLAADNPEELTLIEEWETLEAMTAHFRSRDFRAVLSVIDLSKRAPEIRLDSVTSTEGIERLTELLAG